MNKASPSRLRPVVAMLGVVALTGLAGCGTDDRSGAGVSVRVASLSLCSVALKVQITVGTKICPLAEDTATGGFSGRCQVSEVGTGIKVLLQYNAEIGGKQVELARAETTVDIVAGAGDIPVKFPATLDYPDFDGDGLKSIDEVCLGHDPTVKDAPRLDDPLTDPPTHEAGAFAGADVYLIGERITLHGDNLPAAKFITVTIGPTLAGGTVDVPLLSAKKTALELAIPPGLDVAKVQTLTVQMLTLEPKWTAQIKVSRALVVSGLSRFIKIHAFRGDYTVPALASKVVCLPDDVTNCETSFDACHAILHEISADGRSVVGQCSIPATHKELFVVDLPTGQRWPGVTSSLAANSPTAFVLGGRYLAQLDAGTGQLSLRTFDGVARTLGPPIETTVITDGIGLRAARDGKAVYVFARGGLIDSVTRVTIDDGGAAPKLTVGAKLELGDGCANQGADDCLDYWSRSMYERVPGVLLLARPLIDTIERIDFNQSPPRIVDSTSAIPRAHSITPVPGSTDSFYTLGDNGAALEVNRETTLCIAKLDNLQATPVCHEAKDTKTAYFMAAPPNGSAVAVSFATDNPLNIFQAPFRVFDLGKTRFATAPSGHAVPTTIFTQP